MGRRFVMSLWARCGTSADVRSETSSRRRGTAALTVALLTAGATLAVGFVTAASADALPGPVTQRDATAGVTADVLPTAQMNGVAWAQKVVGDTVFVGGSFTSARPAGAALGTSETPRSNLMAYTLSTGVMTSWAPVADGQVLAMALSPDGQRLYVGGDFATINGVAHNHIAAFDTTTGNLLSTFHARTDAAVRALTATNTTVYAGGAFSTADSIARSRLAAFSATDGSLLPWNPGANTTVFSMTLNPSASLVIVGGAFSQIANTAATGLAALDPTSGNRIFWAATAVVSAYGQDNNGAGTGAAIYSLSTDATSVFGTAYNYYGFGNLEGTFKADGTTGTVAWVEDCHGDTYGAFATSTAVYTISHAHYCGNMGGMPQTANPAGNMKHALAFTQNATGTINHDQLGHHDWYAQASPSLINWFPEFYTGTYTGQGQAAWTITGTSQYVVTGGEFPAVNGTPQQGLARFAVPSIAPDKQGPRLNSSNWLLAARPLTSTSVRLAIPANWDRDDQNLTYYVVRNNKAISTFNATSQFWNTPMITYLDTGLTPGTTYSYFIKAVDPDGNAQYSNTVSAVVPTSGTVSPYSYAVYNAGAAYYWRLGEPSGTSSPDSSSFENLTLKGTVTHNVAGAINDGNTADKFSGTNSYGSTAVERSAPNVFTEEGWFNTTTTLGGKIVGFGNASTGNSGTTDRHTYINTNGTVTFGINNVVNTTAGRVLITTTKKYNDGKWHYFAGSMSPNGMAFYVDGQLVGTNAATTNGQSYTGYWRVGGDTSWSGANYFNGSIDDVAIYPTALSAAQVQQHYAAASAIDTAPTAAFTASTSNLTANFDATTSTDPDGTISAYAWDFGDGTTGTGASPTHTYATAGTFTVTLTVTDNQGATNAVSHSVTTVAGPFTAAADDFERTATNGWGNATAGGAWTRTTGAVSAYAVDGHLGDMSATTPGSTVAQYLNSVSGANMSGTLDVGYSAVPTGGGSFTYVGVRHTASGEYRIRVKLAPTSTTLQATSVISGTETVLAQSTVAGVVYNLGDVLRIKFNVSGSGTTALQAKVWKLGTSEPAAWQVDTTNTAAALQGPGSFGLLGYLSSSTGTTAPLTFQFDNLSVTQS